MGDLTDRLIAMGIDPENIQSGGEVDLTRPQKPRIEVQQGRGYGKATTVKTKPGTVIEEQFLSMWNLYGNREFEIVAQYYYNPGTRWHCDFAFPALRVLVEIDGLTGAGGHVGGHRSIGGFLRDREHDFWAVCNGWRMVRFAAPMLTKGNVEKLNELLERLQNDC